MTTATFVDETIKRIKYEACDHLFFGSGFGQQRERTSAPFSLSQTNVTSKDGIPLQDILTACCKFCGWELIVTTDTDFKKWLEWCRIHAYYHEPYKFRSTNEADVWCSIHVTISTRPYLATELLPMLSLLRVGEPPEAIALAIYERLVRAQMSDGNRSVRAIPLRLDSQGNPVPLDS